MVISVPHVIQSTSCSVLGRVFGVSLSFRSTSNWNKSKKLPQAILENLEWMYLWTGLYPYGCVGLGTEWEVLWWHWEGDAQHVSWPVLHLSCPVSLLQVYSVSQKKSPLGDLTFFHFFHKRLRICNQFFTHLLNVPIFARLQIFIQLSPILTKSCHIKRDYAVHIICAKCPKRAHSDVCVSRW